jgi:hypothetical protein
MLIDELQAAEMVSQRVIVLTISDACIRVVLLRGPYTLLLHTYIPGTSAFTTNALSSS